LELYTCFDRLLTLDELSCLRDAIKRRGVGEPLQYISGVAPFRHLELKVSPGVLIPRPETETLVQLVLDWLKVRSTAAGSTLEHTDSCEHTRILDIATGSGCVALSLALEVFGAQVVATDISSDAVALATENARLQGLDTAALAVIQDDLAGSLIADCSAHASFDVVVSNPPYIPSGELELLPREVYDYEPVLALDGGADGLDVYRRLIGQAATLLRPRGLFACELHETNLDQAALIIGQASCVKRSTSQSQMPYRSQCFDQVTIHKDLAGRLRFITAVRSGCACDVGVEILTGETSCEHGVLLRTER